MFASAPAAHSVVAVGAPRAARRQRPGRPAALALGAATLLGLARSAGAGIVEFTDEAGRQAAACASEFMKGSLDIRGEGEYHLTGHNGESHGDRVTLKHNASLALLSHCERDWVPESIAQLKLLGRTIRFTVDLSKVGCACNVAFYLIASPARDMQGNFSRGKDRNGQPAYYCDANQIGGQWCPEVDIMEANNHAFQATPHSCTEPTNGHYSFCDRSGCAQNTNDQHGSFGPHGRYTIDTRQPFQVETAFPERGGVLVGMRTTLRQRGRQVVLAHDSCDMDYFAGLTGALKAGMSLRMSYWGSSAQTMAWMDSPPCGQQACSGENAGEAVISDIAIGRLLAPLPLQSEGRQRMATPRGPPSIVTGAPRVAPATAPRPLAPHASSAPSKHVQDGAAAWQCHQYVGDQAETGWCARVGIHNGFEYAYNGGQDSPCGGCWCCKRAAKHPDPSSSEGIWVVSDEMDRLHGQQVPPAIMAESALTVHLGDHAVVHWQGAKHFVRWTQTQKSPATLAPASTGALVDAVAVPTATTAAEAPQTLAAVVAAIPFASIAGCVAVMAAVAVAVAVALRKRARVAAQSYGVDQGGLGVATILEVPPVAQGASTPGGYMRRSWSSRQMLLSV